MQVAHVGSPNLAPLSLQLPATGGLASGASSSHLAGARRVTRFGHWTCPRDGHAARLFKPFAHVCRSRRPTREREHGAKSRLMTSAVTSETVLCPFPLTFVFSS